jgi:NTE family protein
MREHGGARADTAAPRTHRRGDAVRSPVGGWRTRSSRASSVSPAAPADAVELLRRVDLFSHLDDDQLRALLDDVEWLRVPAGTRLFSAGDAPDGMYAILSGRVRFFAEDGGTAVLTAEAGEGISFGEGSLLIGGGRSRTAIVVRDADLARIAPDHFRSLMATTPELASHVARMLAARISFRYEPPGRNFQAETTVIVPLGNAADVLGLADDLARETNAIVRRAGVAPHGAGGLLVVEDPHDPDTVAECLRQADRILVVGSARDAPSGAELPPGLRGEVDPLAAPPVELVLVRDGDLRYPTGSARWLARHPYARHHHVRRGNRSDVSRLARHLTGRAVGLVLGGGGARGMAHIGVLKALDELSIPVDHVGGSSIGAIIGGQVAMGSTWDQILEHSKRTWASRLLRFDVTLPTVSVSSGRRARHILEETFGELAIEDFLLSFFCTSVNLSRFRLDVHRRGPSARWIRASASAPGLWPPVVDDDGELHIDGGQLNSVPTDVMRADHLGPIIAADVCAIQRAMTVPVGSEPPTGVRHLRRRRFRHRFPSLVDTLNRCALLGSLQHRETAAAHADVYLTPDVGTIGFSGFARMDEAVDVGYRAAIEGLRRAPVALGASTPAGTTISLDGSRE